MPPTAPRTSTDRRTFTTPNSATDNRTEQSTTKGVSSCTAGLIGSFDFERCGVQIVVMTSQVERLKFESKFGLPAERT